MLNIQSRRKKVIDSFSRFGKYLGQTIMNIVIILYVIIFYTKKMVISRYIPRMEHLLLCQYSYAYIFQCKIAIYGGNI
nr:MAG TPA: hypothetical protein [Caudoviricetes sp.]